MTDDRDDGSTRRSGGFFGILRSLVDTLREMDEQGDHRRSATRSRTSGKRQIDYGIDVGTLDGLDVRSEESVDAGGMQRSEAEIEVPTSVIERDGGVTVYFDLPEVAGETIQAGVDGRTLAVGVDDIVLTRVTLPRWGLTLQFGSYNNGVLECFLTDADSDTETRQ